MIVPSGIPLATIVDYSVFYAAQTTIRNAGYIDMDGALTVGVYPKPIDDYIPLEAEERTYGGDVTNELSVSLPAITVTNMDDAVAPGGLGGDCWERRYYEINVYGAQDGQERELGAYLSDALRQGIKIYDFNMGYPGNSDFPLPNQLIGTFYVEHLRDQRVLLPSYSSVDKYHRRLTFEVINLS